MSAFTVDLPKHSNLVHTLFRSDKVQYSKSNNDHRVICKVPIKRYEVIHIEHVLSVNHEDSQILLACVNSNAKLYNSLYPRVDVWSERLISSKCKFEEDAPKLVAKLHHNVITYGQALLLGDQCSYYNSSEQYNACMRTVKLDISVGNFPQDVLHILTVFALRDILPGEEVFLYYPCEAVGMNEEVNSRYIGDATMMSVQDERRIMKHINDRTMEYLKSKMFQSILVNQMLAFIGFFYQSNIYVKTDRFREFVTYTFPLAGEEEAIAKIIYQLQKMTEKIRVMRGKNDTVVLKE